MQTKRQRLHTFFESAVVLWNRRGQRTRRRRDTKRIHRRQERRETPVEAPSRVNTGGETRQRKRHRERTRRREKRRRIASRERTDRTQRRERTDQSRPLISFAQNVSHQRSRTSHVPPKDADQNILIKERPNYISRFFHLIISL